MLHSRWLGGTGGVGHALRVASARCARACSRVVTLAGLAVALGCGRGRDEPAPAAAPFDLVDGHAPVELGPPKAAPLAAEVPAAEVPTAARSPTEARPSPPLPQPGDTPPTHFEGREIAPTMGYEGAAWLTRPERDAEEDATRLHEALAVAPGQTACDVGAGSGYHTLRLARAVGPRGRVLAVDLQPQMLAMLHERVAAAGLRNVETITATESDPRLPEGACDLILLVDVYHELAWPEPMLAAFRRALAPAGRLALVEFRAEDPNVPIKRLHKLGKAQIDRELLPRGFRRVEGFDGLPWQHLVVFVRDDLPAR